MPHDDLSPAERDLRAAADHGRTTAINSGSMLKALASIQNRLDAMNPRPPPSGFISGGEYMRSIFRQRVDHINDPRLVINSVGTFGREGVGGDGGFLMPSDHRREVLDVIVGSQTLTAAFAPIPATTGLVVLPGDDTSEWSASGVAAEVLAEGATIAPATPVLGKTQIFLADVKTLTHCSENLIRDNPAYADYLWRKHARRIADKIESLLVNGTGAGEPLGVLNAPSKVTITPAASTSTVIGADDVTAMIGRLFAGQFASSFWIASTSALVAAAKLAKDGLYTPEGGVGFGRLVGRPIHVSEHAAPLGTEGDLILVAPRAHPVAIQGPSEEATIEFLWEHSLSSFRSVMRMGAAHAVAAPVQRRTGTDTLGGVVVLATRS